MKEEDNFHQKSRSWFSKSSTTQGHNFTSLGGPKESEKILGLTSNHHGMGSKEAWSTACPMSQFDGDVPCETVRSPNQRDLVKRSRDMVTTCPHNVSKGIDKELEWADTLTHLHTSSIGQTLFEVFAVPGDPCSFAFENEHIHAVTASLRSEVTQSQVSSPPVPSPARAGLQQNLLSLRLGEPKKKCQFWSMIWYNAWSAGTSWVFPVDWGAGLTSNSATSRHCRRCLCFEALKLVPSSIILRQET